MPTGYTAAIKDGISFKKYAMDCARAFGACIDMRDEPADKEIPAAFELSNYHVAKIEEAVAEIASIAALTMTECVAGAQADYDSEVERWAETKRKSDELKDKYEAMLAEVQAWKPPTPEHEELKRFMRDQILESIRFDCRDDEFERQIPRLTATEWLAKKTEAANRSLAYHTAEHAKEVQRNEGRTAWVSALRQSLV